MLLAGLSAVTYGGVSLFEAIRSAPPTVEVDERFKNLAMKVVRRIQQLLFTYTPAGEVRTSEQFKTELIHAKERLADYIDSFLKEIEFLTNMW